MTYIKTLWKNKIVEKPSTFRQQQNADGSVTLIPEEGQITEAGTPINAEKLNNIEDGIETANSQLAEIVQQTNDDITYYVAITGNDTIGDGTSGNPFKTIQYAIDLLPQIINHTVTINVSAGTYNESLVIKGFVGKGSINLNGSTTLDDSKNYVLNHIRIESCFIKIDIRGFTSISTTTDSLYIYNCSYIYIKYFRSVVTSNACGVYAIYSNVFVYFCEFSNQLFAIRASQNSSVISQVVSGSGNTYVLGCNDGVIMKHSSQPSGTTAELVEYGGVIR